MKKSLGQNFLKNELIASSIVDGISITREDTVIEIGPGNGSLTKWIKSKNPKKVFLIEFDRDLIHKLKNDFPSFNILNDNASDFNLSSILKDKEKALVISNLPYNVAKKILFNLIDNKKHIKRMVLMFQKEVGQRLIARVGDSNYSALTILASEFFDIKPLMIVEAKEFFPKPKVDSMVLSFERLNKLKVIIDDRKTYEELLLRVFSNRRKMLRKTLKDYLDKNKFLELKEENIVNLNLRPQNLSIEEFVKLSNFIFSLNL
jgi:16S rRNA (adenine1518-N6/adenine1519-N6)-dimethyltransferase